MAKYIYNKYNATENTTYSWREYNLKDEKQGYGDWINLGGEWTTYSAAETKLKESPYYDKPNYETRIIPSAGNHRPQYRPARIVKVKGSYRGTVTSTSSTAYPTDGQSGSYWYDTRTSSTSYTQGSYIGQVTAEDGTYPDDGRHTDGYWYVRGSLANTAPTIDGYSGSTSIDLGTKTSNFNIEYIIGDQEGGAVSVDIYHDSTKVESGKPIQLGYKNIYTVDLAKFTLGSHFVKIVTRDSAGESSERTYQFYKSNTAPIISGQDEHLGDINSPFTKDFTVVDNDFDTVSVTITLNGQEIKNISNALGDTQTVNITEQMLSGLELGKLNTIIIKADDGKTGVSYRRWTFTRVNKPPIISGSNRDLGIISNVDDLAGVFTVTDLEKDLISAKLFLNDLEIEVFEEVEDGAEISYEIPLKNYVELPKGKHFIKIESSDDKGETSERIITFTKKANKMEFILRINTTDVAAKKILAIFKQTIAEGDNLIIKACNNYKDENPTWEEITAASLAKLVHNFENAAKTGEEWEIALWYICEKNSDPSVRSLVQGISGGYE